MLEKSNEAFERPNGSETVHQHEDRVELWSRPISKIGHDSVLHAPNALKICEPRVDLHRDDGEASRLKIERMWTDASAEIEHGTTGQLECVSFERQKRSAGTKEEARREVFIFPQAASKTQVGLMAPRVVCAQRRDQRRQRRNSVAVYIGSNSLDRQDYILRMIERLGQALIALRNRILGKEVTSAEVRTALQSVAREGGLDYELATSMTPDTLLMMVAPAGEVDPGRCWLLAELSYLDGLDAELSGEVGVARSSFERAGFLFGMLQPEAGSLMGVIEAKERLDEIEVRLAALSPRT